MISKTYYHRSIRKCIIAFGSLFNDLQIDSEDSNGTPRTIKIPLTYTSKEKFIQKINDTQNKSVDIKVTLPRMGFQVGTLEYDSTRKTNSVDKLTSSDGTKFMFNRVPYIIPFNLYIGTRKIEDMLKIIEQIYPYFDPSLVVQITDLPEYDIDTKIPFIMTGGDFSADSDDSLSTRRNLIWTLNFTAQTYLYKAIRDPELIRRTIVNISDTKLEHYYNSYITELDPLNTLKNGEYGVIEKEIEDLPYIHLDILDGSTMEFSLDG